MDYEEIQIEVGKIFKCDGRLFAFSKPDTASQCGNLGGGLEIHEFYITSKKDTSDRT